MGYEVEVPPVPDRTGEMVLISQIKKSFQQQPWYKYYMPEAPRLAKVHYHELRLNYILTWSANFLKGFVMSGLVSLSFPIFFKKNGSGVPFYSNPKMILTSPTIYGINFRSNYLASLRQVPFILIFASLYATYYTSFARLDDELNYRYILPK